MVRGIVLVVAGSDSGGGAGIQADVKAITALGSFAATAVTALTAQNTLGVRDVHVAPTEFITAQIDAVADDLRPNAVKTGMLADGPTTRRVAQDIKRHQLKNVVVDTVMRAKGGASLMDADAIDDLRDELCPLATIVTPNVPEAAALLGMDEEAFGRVDMATRAKELGTRLQSEWVLLKGGHCAEKDKGGVAIDYLYERATGETTTFEGVRFSTPHTHGTGCTLASSIAASLAQGYDVPTAVRRAKVYISEAIRTNPGYGTGHGPLNHLPYYAATASMGKVFRPSALRLYLVSCEALTLEKLEQALQSGVTIVQMRDKNPSTRALVERARAMKAVCDRYSVPFIVNDRCDVAIAVDADGVHLGQSDMTCVEARNILGPNKWIGVSCRTEDLARAAKVDGADYIGCGACFGTDSKGDAQVIGVDGVAKVAAVAREILLPIVAIGGISCETASDVRARTGADGVAVIACVANAPDVADAVRRLLA